MRRRPRLAVALIALAVPRALRGAGRRRAHPERQPDRLPRRRHQPAKAPRDTNGRRSRSTCWAGSTPPTTRRSPASTGSNSNSPGGGCSSPAASRSARRCGCAASTAARRSPPAAARWSGAGQLYAKIFVPNQAPFGVRANLLAFNGKTKVGRPAVLVHAYTTDPPVSFVIPFAVHRQKGSFRTVLVTTLKRSVGTWPHVSNFRIEVARNFIYHGEAPQLPQRLLPGAAEIHRRLPLLRPRHLHLRRRRRAGDRIGPQLPREADRPVRRRLKGEGRQGRPRRSAFPHRIAVFARVAADWAKTLPESFLTTRSVCVLIWPVFLRKAGAPHPWLFWLASVGGSMAVPARVPAGAGLAGHE